MGSYYLTSYTSVTMLNQLLLLTFHLLAPSQAALEREMTVQVFPGTEECFYETMGSGNSLMLEYVVLDGGSGQFGDRDINFRVVNPVGSPVMAEFKKAEAFHTVTVGLTGDYKICFDNQFSLVSSKTVYFEIINNNEADRDFDEIRNIFLDEEADPEYEMSVTDIEEKLKKILTEVKSAMHHQKMIQVSDTKDRTMAEHSFERVNRLSALQVVFALAAGILQVFMVKGFFEEHSRFKI